MNQPKYGVMAPQGASSADAEPVYVDTASPFDPPTPAPGEAIPGEVGNGVLGKFTNLVFWYAVVTVLMAVTTFPAWLLALLIAPDATNLPLIALAMVPVGPAISAALYAVRARYRSEDQGPWRAFWRGYRLNALGVLKFWISALIILGIVGFTLVFGALVGLTTLHRILFIIIGAVVLLLTMEAIAITSFFNFRFSDTMRLAASQLILSPRLVLGLIAVAVLAFGLVWFVNEFVLVAAAGVLAALWYYQVRPSLKYIHENHTVRD